MDKKCWGSINKNSSKYYKQRDLQKCRGAGGGGGHKGKQLILPRRLQDFRKVLSNLNLLTTDTGHKESRGKERPSSY